MPKIAIFSLYQIFSNENGLCVDDNAELLALMGKKCKKIVGDPNMSTIFEELSTSDACMLATFSMSGSSGQ